jgi:SAM-dependent methyltransferase
VTEIQLYPDEFPFTRDWYRERGHAAHLEQGIHRGRFDAVDGMVHEALSKQGIRSIVDLGAGDGGTLSMIGNVGVPTWGYDLMPENVAYAVLTRKVDVRYADFLNDPIEWGDLVICTEVLEHLEDPHALVRKISQNAETLIASSPASETREDHDPAHAWVWDMPGYARMIQDAGFDLVAHEFVPGDYDFQVIWGER